MFRISVGICAFNEAKNIYSLLRAVFNQELGDFTLQEVIVNSDGSTDNTVEECHKLTDTRLRVLDNTDRKGKSYRQQEIFKEFTGDILLMLDADVLPADSLFLARVAQPFMSNGQHSVGLVSCPLVPLSAETRIERIINFSVALKEKLLQRNNNADNIYACHGPVRAFSRVLTEVYSENTIVSEDAYSYLLCKKMGFEFCYVLNTSVYFRSPQTMRDYLKQSARFRLGQHELAGQFGQVAIATSHRHSMATVLRVCLFEAARHPILSLEYCLLFCMSIVYTKFFKTGQSATWDMAASSKKL